MTFAHQSKSYDHYEIMSFIMDISVSSFQMVISLILMGTLAVSVVIVIGFSAFLESSEVSELSS